eukprot:1145757-Pelagomonas_calceolata.AAC.17
MRFLPAGCPMQGFPAQAGFRLTLGMAPAGRWRCRSQQLAGLSSSIRALCLEATSGSLCKGPRRCWPCALGEVRASLTALTSPPALPPAERTCAGVGASSLGVWLLLHGASSCSS